VVGNEAGEPLYRQGQEQVLPSGAVGLPQKHIFVTTTMSLAVLIECLANIQGAAGGCDLLIFYQALTGSVLITGSAFDAGRYRIQ
jgi:hypothetical protein